MPVALASEIWSELKRYISPVDKDEAAEVLINLLIDNDVDYDEIKSNFKGDPEIKRALAQYQKDAEDEPEEEEYDEDDDDQY
jgi:hypothetical protein